MYDQRLREQYPNAFIDSNLDIFDHYFTTEKAAFFRLREAPFIKTFFHLVRQSFDKMHANSHVGDPGDINAIIYCKQSGIRSGSFNSKRLNKLIAEGPSWREIANVP